MSFSVRGTLPEIIRNDAGLYEGDLKVYFKAVFTNAQNLQKGYHNFRHMFHVVWLCYQAIAFYEAMQFKPCGFTARYRKNQDKFWYSIDL